MTGEEKPSGVEAVQDRLDVYPHFLLDCLTWSFGWNALLGIDIRWDIRNGSASDWTGRLVLT